MRTTVDLSDDVVMLIEAEADRPGMKLKDFVADSCETVPTGLDLPGDREVDAIIELPDGTWAAFEVKLGSTREVVDAAAANLLLLKERYRSNPPIARAVITGTGHAFPPQDGALRIPIGTLAA